jgi:hypothetical protein
MARINPSINHLKMAGAAAAKAAENARAAGSAVVLKPTKSHENHP